MSKELPKIERETSKEELVEIFREFLKPFDEEFGPLFIDQEGEYADGWGDALHKVDELIEDLRKKVPELK